MNIKNNCLPIFWPPSLIFPEPLFILDTDQCMKSWNGSKTNMLAAGILWKRNADSFLKPHIFGDYNYLCIIDRDSSMKTTNHFFVCSIFICLVIFSLKTFCADKPGGEMSKSPIVIFGAMVIPGQNEVESLIWASSIRKFGGKFSSNPIWIFIPNKIENLSETKREKLLELGVEFFPFTIDESASRFPLAAKPFAAAEAEKV